MSIQQKKPAAADDFIRIQDLLYLCLAKWQWFVLSLAVTVGIAVFYLLRTPPVYTRTASVLIKDDSKGKSVSSELDSFSEFGLFQSSTNVNNELVALQSPAVMTEVVRRLHLDMNYSVPGRFHRRVAYGPSLPVSVALPELPENESAGFTLRIQPDSAVLLSDFTRNGEEFDAEISGRLSDTVSTPLGILRIETSPYFRAGESYTLYVWRNSLHGTVGQYSSNLSVALSNEKTSIVNLTFRDLSIQRAEDILNTLICI